MAYHTIFELPSCVWTSIAQFADVTESQPSDSKELLAVGNGETDRRLACEAGTLIVGKGSWPYLESNFSEVVRTYANAGMISRRQLLDKTGYVDHDVAQRASIMNSFIQRMDHHNQQFPMNVTIEVDGEPEVIEIDPRPDASEHLYQMLQPVHTVQRGHIDLLPSPFRYRYHTRRIGDDDEVDFASPEARDIIIAKRRFMVHIKAKLFLLLLSGNLPGAFAWDNATCFKPFAPPYERVAHPNKYLLLWDVLVGWAFACWYTLIRVLSVAAKVVDLKWYYALPPAIQASLDLLLISTTLYFMCTRAFELYNREAPPLKVNKQPGENVYLGQIATEKGIYHNIRVNGVELKLPTVPEVSLNHQDEMAMPGSEYFPCKAQPIGAILVCTEGSDLSLFGVFWRMDEYLVTARHCSNTLNQSTAQVYLATIRNTKKGNWEVNRLKLHKTSPDFWAPERNAIAAYDIDAFAVEISEKEWSLIQVTKASTRIRSAYNQQVHSVGFTPDGLLVSASGKTLPGSGIEHLHHTASTQKGFSGSIILCGNSVVGMHVSAAGEHNVAVRTEMIQYLIDAGTGLEANTKNRKKYTYADASYKEHYRQQKWRGGVAEIKAMRDGKFAVELRNGEATYGWSMKELVDIFGTGNAAKDEDMFEDMLASNTFARRYGPSGGREQYIDHDDDRYYRNTYENASIASEGRRKTSKRKLPKSQRPSLKIEKEDMSWLYHVEEGHKPVHGPSAPKMQPEASQLFEHYKNDIVALGYVEGEFSWPEMTPQEERKSLENHLKIFGDATKLVTEPPTAAEIERCSTIVATMMEANAFVPDEDYNQLSGIINVIHSSIIGTEKSSGYPYVEQGLVTNGQVLERYGVKGFAQHVLNEWDSDYTLKVMGKGEPTKKKKILEGRPRVIVGMPTHATVKHASILKNFMFGMVRFWKQSPIKYAFSPANPGHLEHMKEVLPKKVYESDKEVFDFHYQEWNVECSTQVVTKLANRHPNWSAEQFDVYKKDLRKAFDQVFKNSIYRTSDGHVYRVKKTGIMKSGWWGTIGFNSITQVEDHVMVMMRLGYSDEEIIEKAIVAGGDDVDQDLEGVDLEKYTTVARSLGVVTEIHVKEDLEHSEYFSNDIRRGKNGLEFHPKRWTKHIEHLKTVKKEFLADALCSHMENYRHNEAKFTLFENMYHRMKDSDPGLFPVNKLKSRDFLLAKQYGYESVYA